MTATEMLEIGDRLLPLVARRAQFSVAAFDWLAESARRWARSELARREGIRGALLAGGNYAAQRQYGVFEIGDMRIDATYIEAQLRRFQLRHVAALCDCRARFDAPPVERIYVGLLAPGCNSGYLKLNQGFGRWHSGMQDIYDIIEVDSAFTPRRWPE